jgi:hypothetical protein
MSDLILFNEGTQVQMLPLRDGTAFEAGRSLIEVLRAAYPGIDIEQELRKMEAWLLCNPQSRKTRRGVTRFINAWLARARTAPQSTRSRSLADDLNDRSWAK